MAAEGLITTCNAQKMLNSGSVCESQDSAAPRYHFMVSKGKKWQSLHLSLSCLVSKQDRVLFFCI